MQTRDIPHDQWHTFLDDFSRRHAGECVSIEALEGQNGRHALASNVRLVGITDDPKNSEGEMIEVMAGDSPDSQTNHEVRSPPRGPSRLRRRRARDGRRDRIRLDADDPGPLRRAGLAQKMYGPSTKPS